MKLLFKTTNPESLEADIIEMIEAGKLQTWTIQTSESIKYLKHTWQWGEKGVIQLTASSTLGHLKVEVLKFKSTTEAVKDFEGYYLGRFCELIFLNFPDRFTSIGKG